MRVKNKQRERVQKMGNGQKIYTPVEFSARGKGGETNGRGVGNEYARLHYNNMVHAKQSGEKNTFAAKQKKTKRPVRKNRKLCVLRVLSKRRRTVTVYVREIVARILCGEEKKPTRIARTSKY